jgi:4-alpha-glucanotransferase
MDLQAQPWRGAGVALPVFSVRSTESVGAGEFLDLNLVVDMAAKTGMRLVQLLPVNDTSVNMMWWDSYPYRYLSTSLTELNVFCIAFESQIFIH